MFVKVSASGGVSLEDPNNFRAFKVVVEGDPAAIDNARRALVGLADVSDKETAWVFEAGLRKCTEVANDAAWQGALGTMIEKARPHGWVDDARKAIRAHIEWVRA